MLVAVADTHGRETHRLEGHTLEAVRAADLVVHAGDFTTGAVLDAFEREAATLRAVYGNNDTLAVRERLPATRVVEWDGLRVAMAHGHDHSATALSLFARQEEADLVVVGHSHRPAFSRVGDVPVVNPGSHAEPRRYRPAHAELERDGDGVRGRLCEPDGTVFERFRL